MLNDYVMKKLNTIPIDSLVFAQISFDRENNTYYLMINDGKFNTETNITRDMVKIIFYRILSYGKIPQDNLNGDYVNI
jgi:hypothetical protein